MNKLEVLEDHLNDKSLNQNSIEYALKLGFEKKSNSILKFEFNHVEVVLHTDNTMVLIKTMNNTSIVKSFNAIEYSQSDNYLNSKTATDNYCVKKLLDKAIELNNKIDSLVDEVYNSF